MATKSSTRKDLNQSAFAIVQQAMGEAAPTQKVSKGKAAGGIKRAENLTSEQRVDAARLAAMVRWKKTK